MADLAIPHNLAFAVCAVLVNAGANAGPFDVAGRAPEWAIVTTGAELVGRPEPSSPMLDLICGVIARPDRKMISDLRACGVGVHAKNEDPPADAARWCVVQMGIAQPGIVPPARVVEILRSIDGQWFAKDIQPEKTGKPAPSVRLDADKFASLAAGWPKYRGDFKSVPSPGQSLPLAKPYAPGWETMNKAGLGERFLNGRPTSIDGASRVLNDQTFFVRTPAKYDPHEQCGLFVWVDAGPTARVHDCFTAAADELRLIIIAAEKTGNDIYASNRYQLSLDVAETAQERFLIDPQRVYIGGISGGGRISSEMWGCFPDIFTGCVPVVGLDCYESAPASQKGMVHRAGYAKPAARLWKVLLSHRIAPMTGQQDFNYEEISKFVRIYERDRVPIRLFEYPDMAHQLPTAPRFTEAITWVDAPVRDRQQAARQAALDAMKVMPDGTQGEPQWTAKKVALTKADPWSKQAWEAAKELGLKIGQ
ncbi:MAG: hypothetical protein JSR77_18415 [Planctomycetes bacterium]|nr:hypothetical protein [Planctomycetota bacterium]